MAWTKAAVADGLVDAREGARRRRRSPRRSTRRTSTRASQAVERAKKRRRRAARSSNFPDNAKDIKHAARRRRVQRAPLAGARHRSKRVDGRAPNEVRAITIDTSLLPRAHGSALFTRGQTQALVAVTLGTANDVQRLDSIDDAGRDDEVVHAALQLPAVLHRRSAPDARHQPPRDRPRQPGRARAAGRAAAVRGVPVHDPHRLRRPRVERLVVDGVGVRRLARAVRRRRSDPRAPSPAWRWA